MALTDSILKARDCADRMMDLRRKAAPAGGAVPGVLVGEVASGPLAARENLGQHAEQYRHFTGWVYAAISAIAKRIAGQTVYVGDRNRRSRRRIKALGEQDEALENHPLLDSLADPNPLMVASNLMFSTAASLLITGKAYWWLLEGDGRYQIWPLPAHWCEPADRLRTGWLVRPPGVVEPIRVPAEFIALFRLPDPGDPFGAVSPLQSQSRAVVADDTVQEAQVSTLNNGIHPTAIITVGKMYDTEGNALPVRPNLTPQQRTQLINAIRNTYAGVTRRGDPIILDGMIESVEAWGRSAQEMDFLNSSDTIKKRITQAFGVNPLIFGEIEGANRAQAVVAEQSFATNVCNPLIEIIGQTVTKWVCPLFARGNERLVCWIEPVRANDPEQTLKEMTVAATRGWITGNEYRRVILGLPELPGLDDIAPPPSPPAVRPAGQPNGQPNGDGQREVDESADDDAQDDAQDRAAKRLAARLVYGRASRNGRHR